MTQAKSVTVIAPLHRPGDTLNVWANFCQQTCQSKRLVVVENGPALGTCKAHGIEPTVVLTSQKHKSHALNVGLDWCRANGGGYWTVFDGDDWYGPQYLAELLNASGSGDVVGKCAQFVRTAGGTLRLFAGTAEDSVSTFVRGPTISGWSEDALEFTARRLWGEDLEWLARMTDAGATCWATSRYHYLYRRHPAKEHTWVITDWQLAQLERGKVYDCGAEDLSVVVKASEPPLFEEVPKRGKEPWDHPNWIDAWRGKPPFAGEQTQERIASFLLNTSRIFTGTKSGALAALRIERELRKGTGASLGQQDATRLNGALKEYTRQICPG